MGAVNWKLPFAATGSVCSSEASTRPEPTRPLTVPPSLTATGLQKTNRLVTSAPATVPVAGPPAFDPVTQSWRGRLGEDSTVTA